MEKSRGIIVSLPDGRTGVFYQRKHSLLPSDRLLVYLVDEKYNRIKSETTGKDATVFKMVKELTAIGFID